MVPNGGNFDASQKTWIVLGWRCSSDYIFKHGSNREGLKVAIIDVNEKKALAIIKTLGGEMVMSLATLLRLLKSKSYDVVNADIYETRAGAVTIERVYIV